MFKNILLSFIKPALRTWLEKRALVVPDNKIVELAKKSGVDPTVIRTVIAFFSQYVLQEFDSIKL